MAAPLYPRGSEWRRWDLQVHSPHSALNNGFGNDFDEYAKRLFEAALSKGIAAIGITDYFAIDGYRRLREIQEDDDALTAVVGADRREAARRILILPNIELRTSVIITRPGGASSRVNFHVLFSDTLSPDIIDEHFLRELKFTAEAAPDHPDDRWSLTSANLSALGARLKKQHPAFANSTDTYVGMLNAVVSHEDVTSTLDRQASRFKDKFLLVTPADEDLSKCSWDGQAHLARKLFIQKSHMLFSSNANTRAFGLGLKHPSVPDFVAEFKSLKPCIHGSDAHSYERLFEPAENRHLWIKADPTFEGLRQVLHEPADRVFVGAIPPSLERAKARPTKIVDSVQIYRAAGAGTPESWFDCSLPLNPELVAIIGNKGSGKSALADVLGLVGNTKRVRSFAFLNDDRFRQPRNNKARHFVASLTWGDGKTDGPVSLADDPDSEAVEKVRYVPQNYLEEICNEVTLGRDSRFYRELQDVIFSHVGESERLGFETLDDLLDHKGEEVNKGIAMLVAELTDINRVVVGLEERLTQKHRRGLESQRLEKERELEAHDQRKPAPVSRPESDPTVQEQSRQVTAQLDEKQSRLQALDTEIGDARKRDGQLARRKTAVERLATKLRNIQRQVDASMAEAAADLAEVGLTREQVVTVEVQLGPVEQVGQSVEAERRAIAADLDPSVPGGRAATRQALGAEVAALQESLSAPQRLYQEYLQTLKEWEARRGQIVGTSVTPGSLSFISTAIDDLAMVPDELMRQQRARRRKALEILREKAKLRRYYEDYYGAVQAFLAAHEVAAGDAFRVTFSVTMLQTGFADAFLAKINQRKLGAFTGVESGASQVKQLTDEVEWNSARSALRFAERVVDHLKGRGENERSVQDQLVQGESTQGVYDYLFSFTYVAPIYRLTWDGKGLEQLSPGERGNLLLIFYLLVDRDDVPLVIDQPEENLDNQTVVRTLVPCLKDAKRRRQIVVVTHNPNLAVVCDAEQVIHAEIRKDHANEVRYVGGSIEEPMLNQKIIDVLEGTRPAFDQRDARYQP